MRVLCIFVLITISGCASWNEADTALTLGIAMDAVTTHQIQYTEVRELNPWLSTNPGTTEVYGYFAATWLVHMGVSKLLPEKWQDRYKWVFAAYYAGYGIDNCLEFAC